MAVAQYNPVQLCEILSELFSVVEEYACLPCVKQKLFPAMLYQKGKPVFRQKASLSGCVFI